jgi:hypothetical protein
MLRTIPLSAIQAALELFAGVLAAPIRVMHQHPACLVARRGHQEGRPQQLGYSCADAHRPADHRRENRSITAADT